MLLFAWLEVFCYCFFGNPYFSYCSDVAALVTYQNSSEIILLIFFYQNLFSIYKYLMGRCLPRFSCRIDREEYLLNHLAGDSVWRKGMKQGILCACL